MNETPEDDLHDALRRMSGSLRPTVHAPRAIHARVRRARRRRAFGTAFGVAGLVVAIAVGSQSLAGSGPTPRPVQPRPATAAPSPQDQLFECPTESRVFTETTTIADLETQQQVLRRLTTLSSVQVRHAAPSPLGVVALVVDDSGDPDSYADPAVVAQLREVGVAHVFEWDPTAATAGMDADGQVRQVLQWLLQPALNDVRSATRDLSGAAGIALWQDAGAVLLQWKAPAPQEVLALNGTRPDGVTVIVESVDYSRLDIQRAQRQLQGVLREYGHRDRWSSSYGCGDGSGLIVGMAPPLPDRGDLQTILSDALDLPVMVVPEDRTRLTDS